MDDDDTIDIDPITGERVDLSDEGDGPPPKVIPGVQGFQPGHEKSHGREKGTPNRITTLVREAIVLAAEQVGEDGKGKDGLVGYLRLVAVIEPKAYVALLGKILPYQINATVGPPEDLPTPEDVARELEARGLPRISIYGKSAKAEA